MLRARHNVYNDAGASGIAWNAAGVPCPALHGPARPGGSPSWAGQDGTGHGMPRACVAPPPAGVQPTPSRPHSFSVRSLLLLCSVALAGCGADSVCCKVGRHCGRIKKGQQNRFEHLSARCLRTRDAGELLATYREGDMYMFDTHKFTPEVLYTVWLRKVLPGTLDSWHSG